MPIASKLVYFQRRPPPAPPDPPDPRRRSCRDRRRSSLSSHHKQQVQELVPGNQRDAAKPPGLTGAVITEHVGGISSSTRLNRSVSDHGRLPYAVQQARERLLQRLNSVDLSGRRQKTWPSERIWAGLTRPADLGVSTSTDSSILGSLTNCFQPSEYVPSFKVQESEVEPVGNADKSMPITLFPQHAPELLQHVSCRGESEEGEHEEPCAECSICLERCDDADGLIQLCCEHVFHSTCLEQWLRSHGDCPYCRASVIR